MDILIAENDTGAAFQTYSTVSQELLSFATGINSQNWDWHLATIPLTTPQTVNQVAASQYDSNWGAQWTPDYPGQLPNGPGTIVPQFFRELSQYTGFLAQNQIKVTDGTEPGFETIRQALYGGVQPSNFMRSDALTVVVIISQGDDTSQVNMCPQNDGRTVECEYADYPSYPVCNPNNSLSQNVGQLCQDGAQSYDYYKLQFAQSKPDPNSIRFYAVVSGQNVSDSSCYGGNAFYAGRYMDMAAASGGQSFGVCNGDLSGALAGIASQLTTTRLNLETKYLFISQAPQVSTIQVTEYVNGQNISVPQDPNNGWTYDGYLSNVYTIDYPIPMNLASGYAIELHGSAKMIGSTTAKVTYTPEGSTNTRSN